MIYRRTQSLCPICLRRIEACYENVTPKKEIPLSSENPHETVFLTKTCPEHGFFSVPIWRRSQESPVPLFTAWSRPKLPSYPEKPATTHSQGCPYDCGLCPEHAQHTCTGLVEVTMRCNLNCPVCYADAGSAVPADPSLDQIAAQFTALRTQSGRCSVQISGGEPTVREDLPQIIALAAEHDFGLVQLNTNGLRLAEEPGYAEILAKAGLESVYLQFDGTCEETSLHLRGRPCLERKLKAIEACKQAGLGIVLVATLIKDINDHELGDLLRLALSLGPNVRGLHLQPCAFFGRYPYSLDTAPRLTLPEVLESLACQAPELVNARDFHPPACEHELCSFSCVYQRSAGGLIPLKATTCSCKDKAAHSVPRASEGADLAKRVTQLNWKASQDTSTPGACDSFSNFLAKTNARSRFTISCMAFQDALSLDLARVRGCCIHVVTGDGRLVPFCLRNLSSLHGHPLYPRIRTS